MINIAIPIRTFNLVPIKIFIMSFVILNSTINTHDGKGMKLTAVNFVFVKDFIKK